MTFAEYLGLPEDLRKEVDRVATEENIPPWSLDLDNFYTAQMVANLAFEEATGHEEKYDCYERSL